MRILSVLVFLTAASLRNRALAQLRRLKRPRYVVATAFALVYLWLIFGRRLGMETVQLGPVARSVIPSAFGLVWFALLLSNWIFGRKRPALTFSEAEIQLLFPAPLSRRALLLYKVARSLLLVLFTALLTSALFGARMTGSFLFFFAGAWAGFGLHALHEMGVQLTRGGLVARGRRGIALLAGGIVASVIVLVVAGFVGLPQIPELPLRRDEAFAFVQRLVEGPLGIALVPLRAPLELALAPDLGHALRWAPVVLVLLALHVAWILRSDTAFEEASLEEAERRARLRESRRTPNSAPAAGRPTRSSALAARGRPELALAWKNLLAARRLWGSKLWALALPIAVMVVMFGLLLGGTSAPGGVPMGIAISLAGAAAMVSVIGPGTLRSDLRADHAHMDLLRAMPLSGAQVVAGELAGPWLLLTMVQWGLLLASGVALGAAVFVSVEAWEPLALFVGLGAVLVLPCVTLIQLLVQNAVVLLLPGWADTGAERSRGLEAMGQRMLLFIGGLFVLVAVFLPAAAIAGVVGALGWWVAGPVAIPLAAAVGAAVLLGEAALAILFLGRAFERYDLTSA